MDKIYMDAKDKNVAKVVIYVKIDDQYNIPYADAACTVKFPVDELPDAFAKGVIVRRMAEGSIVYEMIPFAINSGNVHPCLNVLTPDGSTGLAIPKPKK